jgi:Methyltransferase domain
MFPQPEFIGGGSELSETVAIREQLPPLFEMLNIRTILDAPCGDFVWMNALNYEFYSYLGVDIWETFVTRNQSLYKNEKRRFIVGDIVNEVFPKADVILCRDCLVHLPYQSGLSAIENFRKSGSKYLISTSYFDVTRNEHDLGFDKWDWRKVNLELPPYNLGRPITSLVERGQRCEPGWPDFGKQLSVWALQ